MVLLWCWVSEVVVWPLGVQQQHHQHPLDCCSFYHHPQATWATCSEWSNSKYIQDCKLLKPKFHYAESFGESREVGIMEFRLYTRKHEAHMLHRVSDVIASASADRVR